MHAMQVESGRYSETLGIGEGLSLIVGAGNWAYYIQA